MIDITFTQYFQDFLDQYDEEKQEKIKDIVKDYCDHKKLLPRPKTSALRRNVQKVALKAVVVVIFYIDFGTSWLILTGIAIPKRVS